MPERPKLSIITVTYQAVQHLGATIQSIKAQHFEGLEYLIIDGGSTDGTLEVIKANESVVNVFVSEKDNGLYDAMNKGLRMAKGYYVMFLNAGDIFYDSQSLKKLFEQSADQDILYGDTVVIDSSFKEIGLRHLSPPQHLTWESFRGGMVVCHQAIVAKRAICPEYNTQYRIAADIDWAIRLVKLCKSSYFYQAPFVKFMQDGMSTKHRKLGLQERYSIMVKHYGWISTLLNNIKLGMRYFLSLRFIQNIRKS